MFENHASHVIMELSHRCRRAGVDGNTSEARRLAKLASMIEDEFPEARGELNALYPQEPN